MMSKSQRRFARDAGILALGAMFTFPAVAIDTAPTWNAPELVDNVPNYFLNFDLYEGQDRYLAFDNYGEPGIAYSEVGGLKYARRTPGLGWAFNTTPDNVDPDGYNAIAQPALAFDLAEEPHLSYAGNNLADNHRVSLVSFDSGLPDWVHQNLWGGGGAQSLEKMSTAVAINQFNRAAVVFQPISLAMRFMEDQDGSGTLVVTGTLDNALNDALDISLAFDHLARPMVAAGLEDGELRLWVRDLGSPGFLSVSIAFDAEHPSLAIDPDTGFPAIAWHNSLENDLEYAEWDGDQWVYTTIDSTNFTGLYPSLAFDPGDGRPAIAYQDISEGDLKLAWHDGQGWNIQTVVDQTIKVPTGYNPSLAFNEFGDGLPAIAYFDIAQDLHYVADPLPATGDLDSDGVVGIIDFLSLLTAWGNCSVCANCPADLNDDCDVNVVDMLILLENWS
jgi:hypothetical protein